MGAAAATAEPAHGIAMHGQPRLAADFQALPYARLDAPKGGAATFAQLGSFDSINPLIVKGNAAAGVRDYVLESLLARNHDEPFALYGLIAESVDVTPDRTQVTFRLRSAARFSDGHPVLADDVVFSHQLLARSGRPNLRAAYAKAKAEKLGEREVRFTFAGNDREMPLIIGLMPILPEHATDAVLFEATSLAPMIGSGPYRIAEVSAGRTIRYARDPEWWGRDLPVNRGLYNFDRLQFDYYRDENAMFEAFKRGLVSYQVESDPARWATGYDFPGMSEGRTQRREVAVGTPAGMSAFVMNARRPALADIRVRRALAALFDGEWINRTLYHGLYTRTTSYFARSELASAGLPASPAERLLLAPHAAEIDARALAGLPPPGSDGSLGPREARRDAVSALAAAGYRTAGGRIVAPDGQPLVLEMLAASREQERRALAFARQLDAAGITLAVRLVDSAQYQRRRTSFDYDLIEWFWPASLSPGNEQNFRWSRAAADAEGSFNFPGVRSAAVDAMIAALLGAETREDFVTAARALDRALLSGAYVIPLFHAGRQWIAWNAPLVPPERFPLVGSRPESWWAGGAP